MSEKLDRIRTDLEKAREKHEHWGQRVKALEVKLRDQENTEIHDMVRMFGVSPERLAEILKLAQTSVPAPVPTEHDENTQEDNFYES